MQLRPSENKQQHQPFMMITMNEEQTSIIYYLKKSILVIVFL
jgi:hypothetical protein